MSGAVVASLRSLDGVVTASGVAVASGDRLTRRMLPVRAELAAVLPWGGLRRGSTVAVRGSTALLLATLAEATAAGSWAAVVGLPGLGVLAAAEAGVATQRLALVPRPGDELVAVVAAVLDGVDVVVVAEPERITPGEARRLSARARQRGAVLVPFGSWPAADLELSCDGGRWSGLGDGWGRLREREVVVRVSGRGAAARPRSARMLLPAPGNSSASPSGLISPSGTGTTPRVVSTPGMVSTSGAAGHEDVFASTGVADEPALSVAAG
ncbi:hypothetical protein LX15_005286 [Streptoalloteichus tenebrarius]|uniref:Recombinase A n=1 Tax=Streptoalloteichus tenebrarius (strain ATCC 17920 / DSM 40477 / JCM 4838 / CBS 697.72 / NBRC 16177 / NCIMB 11028 / NRRL B-12390 / A12253. 1 / ISP 5477) TaxID=1933 RepID=A0ABT1I1V5_STRSD|nr:hypothetical protein [Streptoalloteichus tenebrarius]MCP2261560.1 hypothetical protein [Streptoalloteichus tenebrarius]BFF02664.1 hypothetical protein GCM10020241_43390 [Streptoalloteichus tenebrarius]